MKKLQLLCLCFSLVLSTFGVSDTIGDDKIIESQAIIKLFPNARPELLLNTRAMSVKDSIPGRRLYLVSIADGTPISEFIEGMTLNPKIEYVEPSYEIEFPENYQMSISFPDGQAGPLIKGISPPEFFNQPAVYSIGIDAALTVASGRHITVAVIDNGIDMSHPLFEGSLAGNLKDFVEGDDDPGEVPGTAYGHGTFVAGLVLLNSPDCKIMPLRAFDGDGIGNSFWVARAIYHAQMSGADVMNLSFGMSTDCQIIREACESVIGSGIVLVAAAGNESSGNPSFPAAIEHVIAVSALDTLDYCADFSNFGPHIDVCAPGVNLYSTLAGDYRWGTWSGTSFSAPLVTATCALVLSLDREFTSATMRYHLQETSSAEFDWGSITPPNVHYGFGRIDAANAVWAINSEGKPVCGDANGNGVVNMGDVNYIMRYIAGGGPAPQPLYIADVNSDGVIDVDDAVRLKDYVQGIGPEPQCIR